jgi:hypothetical protein
LGATPRSSFPCGSGEGASITMGLRNSLGRSHACAHVRMIDRPAPVAMTVPLQPWLVILTTACCGAASMFAVKMNITNRMAQSLMDTEIGEIGDISDTVNPRLVCLSSRPIRTTRALTHLIGDPKSSQANTTNPDATNEAPRRTTQGPTHEGMSESPASTTLVLSCK